MLRTIQDVLVDNHVNVGEVQVRGEWTVNGERAHFSLLLPREKRFNIELQSKDEMRFRVEVFNSVEGSYRLVAVVGWLRFVCANGLILGTTLMHLREQHRQQLQIEELAKLLGHAIHSVGEDKETIGKWLSNVIDDRVFLNWVDKVLRERWGIKAAVRVLGIVQRGCDVEPVGAIRDRPPSQIKTRDVGPLPGVDAPVTQIFGVSQVLSWVAGQRAEMSEDLEWRSQVLELVENLISHLSS